MASFGTANIIESQLTKYRIKKNPDGTPMYREIPIPESEGGGTRKGELMIDYDNPFPDHCFSFCSDLRCEKQKGEATAENANGSGVAEFQPK